MNQDYGGLVEDTFAEGFRSIYAEFLVTARDRRWLDHCCHAVTGHGSSTIMCDSEVGVARILDGTSPDQQTPDGRIGRGDTGARAAVPQGSGTASGEGFVGQNRSECADLSDRPLL